MSKRNKNRAPWWRRWLAHPAGKAFVVGVFIMGILGAATFTYFYLHFARLADEKLAEGPISRTAMLFAGPRRVSVGDRATVDEIASELRASGYSELTDNRTGWYRTTADSIEVHPGADSYFSSEPALVEFRGSRVSRIVSLGDNMERVYYELEPELITNLFDRNREKRRLVRFQDIPKDMVNAVLAAEDKRFFQHSGFDPIRVLGAMWANLTRPDQLQGASTLTMQFAGDIWLDRSQRTPARKAAELLITLHLERKLTKEQIFEYYANQIYLGRVGTFDIHGYGQGAQAFFNKDIGDLTIPEAALLAGLPQAPSRYNPFRNPERAVERRNWVLGQMRGENMITQEQYQEAIDTPLDVQMGGTEVGDAPYFVDLTNNWLQQTLPGHDFQGNSDRVYTTLDMNLQREAVEAVRVQLEQIDKRLTAMGRTPEKGWPQVQVALVAVDPHTAAVKALVGGRSYSQSQLDHVVAKRQPGSVFKPFVYAAALNTGIEGGPKVLTSLTQILDEPTTFWYDNKPYEPQNYKNANYGLVTLRDALIKSMNRPTVKVAEMVGYDKVVDMARRAGLNGDIQPTPSAALGSYEVTPLEVAGAYTMFADQGEVSAAHFIQRIRDSGGGTLYSYQAKPKLELDPRVAYLITRLLEDTIDHGTGVRVRLMGFDKPAAGKTGTSHDGWFAGYTSKLLTIVWVGYDDNRELDLEGAQSALPIWTEFMMRAHKYREYADPKPFDVPDGIVTVEVDPETHKIAMAGCGTEAPIKEAFIAGTQPMELCGGGGTRVAGWALPGEPAPMVAANNPRPAQPRQNPSSQTPSGPEVITLPPPKPAEPAPSRGIFGRLLDIFR